jgi:hypothetical protein
MHDVLVVEDLHRQPMMFGVVVNHKDQVASKGLNLRVSPLAVVTLWVTIRGQGVIATPEAEAGVG